MPLAPVLPETAPATVNEAAATAFNPFEARLAATSKGHSKSKKPVVILATILLIAGLAAGGYYGWTLLQPTATTPAAESTTTDEAPAAIDTADDITSEVDAIQADLDAIDETELQDATISDQTLNQ
jgi:uncharacterized protein HemX